MRNTEVLTALAILRGAAVLMGLALLPAPALAQYIGGAPPPLPAAPGPGEVQTPAGTLARAVRMLARSPRDFGALITAGRAALDLGDTQAAIGFFGRAEEVRPSDPAPKIGMGAATAATGDAGGALRWFFEAQRLGATSAALGADRGLAQDLLGNQGPAQADYRAALGGREADEARRRLALSLGISGDRTAAFTALQPLLARRDLAAQRIRAFVLALVGDERGASSAIDQAMPGTGSRMAGFFRLLPTLSAPQKAAAVHLGIFPDPSEIRVAAVLPRIVASPPPVTQRAPVPAPPVARQTPVVAAPPVVRQAPVVATPPVARQTPVVATPTPPPSPILAQPATPPAPIAASTVTALPATTLLPQAIVPQPITPPAPQPLVLTAEASPVISGPPASLAADAPAKLADAAPSEVTAPEASPPLVRAATDRLSGLDRLLAQADELPVPPAPRPKVERRKLVAADPAATGKAAALKKAAEAKLAAEQKKAAEEKEARESLGLAGANWVQLAGGSNADRMGHEFRRLAARSSALRKRGGAVTEGKDYFRLLTGPFASKSEAQAFVNQLAKDKVDGFSWTRTPATIRIEKLPPK